MKYYTSEQSEKQKEERLSRNRHPWGRTAQPAQDHSAFDTSALRTPLPRPRTVFIAVHAAGGLQARFPPRSMGMVHTRAPPCLYGS
jgi:hypothetical protein